MNKEIFRDASGKRFSKRFPVSQELIDDILNNELKDFRFPIKPVYNPRIRDNGKVVGELYSWGGFKRIKAIEIGKQDINTREFLTDTLLHEFYEAEIMIKQHSHDFYNQLHEATESERHAWIDAKILEFFDGR